MSPTPPFTLQERNIIETETKKGTPTNEIARLINRSDSGVKAEIRKGGGRKKYNAQNRQYEALRSRERKWSGFSNHQKEAISKMLDQGRTQNEIRYRMSCSYDKLNNYLIQNGLKSEKINEVTLADRVDSLEMQVQILAEQLKEILCKK